MDASPFIIPLILFGAYLIGSIPFGVIVGKLAGIGDIRQVGSGNIGATNMVRAGGKKLGALVLVLDMLKGALPLIAMQLYVLEDDGPQWRDLGMSITYCAGSILLIFLLLGHMHPLWLKFRGGKGVATLMGGLFALSPFTGLVTAAVWVGIFLWKHYSSLASLVAASLSPFIYILFRILYAPKEEITWESFLLVGMFFLLLSIPYFVCVVLVLFKHRDNIRRLRHGTEHKFSFSKTGAA